METAKELINKKLSTSKKEVETSRVARKIINQLMTTEKCSHASESVSGEFEFWKSYNDAVQSIDEMEKLLRRVKNYGAAASMEELVKQLKDIAWSSDFGS